jgi:hypothetical protein
MRWQTYLERFPISILAGTALVGLAVGRRIARGPVPGGVRPSAWSPAATVVDAVVTIPAAIQARGDRFPHVTASWQRLGGRVERLVNRMIDDVANVVERAVVPVLVGAVQGLFEDAGIRATYRPSRRITGRLPVREKEDCGEPKQARWTHHRRARAVPARRASAAPGITPRRRL